MLCARPGVSGHRVLPFDFPWGRVAVQPPVAPGYAPLRQADGLVGCVGRPRFLGVEHESLGPCGFNSLFRDRLRAAGPQSVAGALTGMFAAFECGTGRVRVLTDVLGFMPVYVGHDAGGRVAAVGTHLESVAALAGRLDDFDPVSLADLLVHQHVTFPYTTRRGVTELQPACLTEFPVGPAGEVRGGDVRHTILWEPREPAVRDAPDPAELEEELEQALRAAAADVTRGARSAATTLSGGLDSRVVLAALAGGTGVAGGACVAAITYATRENNEVNVARRVARAAGVPHRIAWRGEEFYAELMPRAVGLLGTELRGECHGFCVIDNALDREFDLVVGGFFSDTLFKGHYMPSALRERVRRRSPVYRARRAAGKALRSLGVLPPVKAPSPHFWDRARAMESSLSEGVREALRERRRVRLEQVRNVRPESAEEWVRFWPGSRGDGAYGPQANTRLFTSDELFFHRRLVELAARVPMHEKLGGRLTRRVFPRLYGELGQIENAATGLPPAATSGPNIRQAAKVEGSSSAAAATPQRSPFPWNDVNDSWVDWELLQKHSPTWCSYRAALADSAAVDVLAGVLPGAAEFIRSYRDEAGHLFNRAAVQLAYAVDRVLHRDPVEFVTPPPSAPPAERPSAVAARLARREATSSPANRS
jgi:asparagine synthetase B (glutamine-hydrolysing)